MRIFVAAETEASRHEIKIAARMSHSHEPRLGTTHGPWRRDVTCYVSKSGGLNYACRHTQVARTETEKIESESRRLLLTRQDASSEDGWSPVRLLKHVKA